LAERESSLRLRPAQATDLQALLALERAAFPDPWEPEQLAEELGRQGHFLDLALDPSERLLGYSLTVALGDEMELLRIAVTPSLRRSGLGRTLLRAALARCPSLGVERVFLEVRADNEAAIGLYESLGFTRAGRRRRYYALDGCDALILVLAVAPAPASHRQEPAR